MHQHAQHHDAAPKGDLVRDPVCGMMVNTASSLHAGHGKAEYFFCSERCLHKFQSDPARYVSDQAPHSGTSAQFQREPAEGAQVTGQPRGEYTCPMHPEVRQDHPGSCPRCGMALEPAGPPVSAAHTEWTCPMHPEVVRDAPGSCPTCGMALEPRTAYAEEGENAELVDMRRRFWFAAALTVPLVFLAMGDMLPGHLRTWSP